MTDRPTVLVPVRILEGESIPEGIPELLANAHVVLLGYHTVPEQTAAGQARMQFEDRARTRLESYEGMLAEAGATVETRLVFTHEAQATIDRTIYEHDCLAVLVPDATPPPENVLVAIRGMVGVDRMVELVGGLFGDTSLGITLYHALEAEETEAEVRTLLEGIADQLVDAGVRREEIDVRVADAGDPRTALMETAEDFDAVVVGESDPSVVTYIFGMLAPQVAETFLGPVLVVQRERPEDVESGE